MRTEKPCLQVLAYDYLQKLKPIFSGEQPLSEEIPAFAEFLSAVMPLRCMVLVRLDDKDCCKEYAQWNKTEAPKEKVKYFLTEYTPKMTALLQKGGIDPENLEDMLNQVCPEVVEATRFLALPVIHNQQIIGFAMFGKERAAGEWGLPERELLELLVSLVGISFAGQHYRDQQDLYRLLLNSLLNNMNSSIYVTDIHTDKILFMNNNMKQEFDIEDPEGKVCWQVLQKGMKERCQFCPVRRLAEEVSEQPYQWEEISTVTGHTYENYDSLIRWVDGSLVHLQQSVDVTISRKLSKAARLDELTEVLNRRAGKEVLEHSIRDAKQKKTYLTVGLYDINMLKEVNDAYGHKEGDHLLCMTVRAVEEQLRKGDYIFRLSGDEFVVVFTDLGKKAAAERLRAALLELEKEQKRQSLSYTPGFCYGLVELGPDSEAGLQEVMLQADEKMYEQKRLFRIRRRNERQARFSGPQPADGEFTYDKERLYHALVNSTDDYVYVCNMKTDTFRYPRAMVEEFDLPGEVIHNAAAVWGEKIHEQDRQVFLEANQDIIDGRAERHCVEYRAKNRRGEWVWLRCRGQLEWDENGEPTIFAGIITNLGKKNSLDHVTGLLNKFELEEEIKNNIERGPDHPLGLMILGLDDFKHINDLYDRRFGDEIMRVIAQKIRTALPDGAAVYRLDGDEYGVLMKEAGLEEIQTVFTYIQRKMRHQQEYDGKKYYCTLSGGVAFYPKDAQSQMELIKYAGYALDFSKKNGKNRLAFFKRELLPDRARALELTELLRESVENHFEGFELYYQPQVKASNGGVTGAEALARWKCRKYGNISPIEFIPLLEQSGLIIPVGNWIFEKTVNTCKRWLQYRPDFIMSVNLSYLQVKENEFLPFMKRTLEEAGLSSANLVVELTESYLIRGSESVKKIYEEIRRLGIKIAMDDFGTGYSSLGVLKNSPADIVKIDRTFIKDIKTSHFDATFIRFIAELCRDVGIQVCLEGVEHNEEYKLVEPLQLDLLQGFLFGKPMPERDFEQTYLMDKN